MKDDCVLGNSKLLVLFNFHLWGLFRLWQELTGECWIPPKRYPTSKGKGEAQQDGRRGKIVCTRTQRLSQNVSEGLLRKYGSAVDCSGAGALSAISPFGGGHHYPHHRATRTYTGPETVSWEGPNKTLCTPGPRRKEQWLHKRLAQTCHFKS